MNKNEEFMCDLAHAIKGVLPEKTGFFLMLFPLDKKQGGRSDYVSNADRDEVVTLMMEFIARSQEQGFYGQHVDRDN